MDSGFLKVTLDCTNYEFRIQRLAVDYSCFVYRTEVLLRQICRCSELRKLILVLPEQRALESENPPVSVEFKHLNAKNYDHFKQTRRDVFSHFERVWDWDWVEGDVPELGVYLVRCHTETERAVAKLTSSSIEPV